MTTAELIQQIKSLEPLSNQLELSNEDRQFLVANVSNYANKFLSELNNKKVFTEKTASHLEIKDEGRSFLDVLNLYHSEVSETGINAASGKHLGYVPAGGIFTSAIADFLAAVTNPYAGVYYASPGAATIENEVVNWLKKLFNFPETSVGCLSSGGSISTLIAFTAARDKFEIKNEHIKNSVVYLTEQVHHSTQKALRIIGLEDIIIRYVPMDDEFKMDVNALEELIQKDSTEKLQPFMVVGSAGTTDTGSIDPLHQIADIAEKNKLWFHVDAAYGGFFILTSKKHLFKGIERADSLIVDPHKGLFLPYGIGAVLVKDKASVLHSNYYTANYMQDSISDEMYLSPANLSPELTRHFRGLRMWLPLQYHGIAPFVACLEEKLLLVQYFRNELNRIGFMTGPEPDLSISYFWYPFTNNCNENNKQLLAEIHKDGDVYFSSTMINDSFVIRMAVLVFRTKKETIDRAVTMIERCLKKIIW